MKREDFQEWIGRTHFSNKNEYISLTVDTQDIGRVLKEVKKDSSGSICLLEGIFAVTTDKSIFLTYVLSSERLEQTVLVRVQIQRATQGDWANANSIITEWPAAVLYEEEISRNYSIRFIQGGDVHG